MKLRPLGISGAWLAESDEQTDNRGTFLEWLKFEDIYAVMGIFSSAQQANISFSGKGVTRRIHYSLAEEG